MTDKINVPKEEIPKFSWTDMVRAVFFLLEDKKKKYIFYTTVLITFLFYDLLPSFIVGKVVDFFTNYKEGISLLPFYLYVAFFAVTWGLVSLVRLDTKKKLNHIQSEVNYFTKVKGFERLLDFSIKWHDSENTGNKVERIRNGTDSMKEMQKTLSNDVFPILTTVVGVLTVFFFLKPVFFIFSLVYILIFILVQVSFYNRIVEMNNMQNLLSEKASGTYFEGLSNVLTIKTLGVKNDFKKNVISREELARDYAIKRQTIMNNKWKSFQIVNALALGGILLLAGFGFVDGAISIGSIFVIYTYFQKLNGSVGESTVVLDKMVGYKVSLARMMPIFKVDTSSTVGNQEFPKDWKEITIKNAFFKYSKENKPNDKENESGISDLNILINKFEKVGVVGKSGSGKSTFAKMLLGLYEFDRGEYKIGAVDFHSIKHDEVTGNIALVLQDSEMFNLSLKENITLMRKFDEKLFEQSIEISQLKELIDKLPEGIETLIGEKGYRLSGGERQRIGIARAIYKDPQILVLDEATSSLDNKTEALILNSLNKNLKKKTVISIAHRISTLENSDKIFVFDKGSLVEEGSFEELSKDTRSKFFEVYNSQAKNN